MTTKTSRKFETPVGLFTYTHLALPYYAFGIQQVALSEEEFAMIASPEKALFDKIVSTSNILIRSKRQALNYLTQDLRIDEDKLRQLDISIMKEWVVQAPKKDSLLTAIKMLSEL